MALVNEISSDQLTVDLGDTFIWKQVTGYIMPRFDDHCNAFLKNSSNDDVESLREEGRG